MHEIVDGIRGLTTRPVRFLGQSARQIFLIHDYKVDQRRASATASSDSNFREPKELKLFSGLRIFFAHL